VLISKYVGKIGSIWKGNSYGSANLCVKAEFKAEGETIMSWIRETDDQKPPIIRVMSINSAAMDAVSNNNINITFGASSLTRVHEEAIVAVVSLAQNCRY